VRARLGTALKQPAGQAGMLFVLAGVLGILNVAVPGQAPFDRSALLIVDAFAISIGMVIILLPWTRWPEPASLAVVPAAFALIAASDRFGALPAPAYGVFFVVAFAWIGMWHSPKVALAFGPLGALFYVVPFLTMHPVRMADVRSAGIVIPAAVMLAEVMATTVDKMRRAQSAQEELSASLARSSVTDDLTGIGNRRQGNRLLDSLQPGDALLLLDLDHFKDVNDTFGHSEGDRLLADLGAYLVGATRGHDDLARYGGEEFIIVLRGAGSLAVDTADRLRRSWKLRHPLTTFSVGVAVHEDQHSPALTFGEADAALYEAKASGRDRVTLYARVNGCEPTGGFSSPSLPAEL
jgi:diguanylate cyclase (GGDEF)-like protein